jgi:Exocyst complex component Sec5
LKHYGLDSIFPNVWGDDAYQGRLQVGGDRSETEIKTVMNDQDNADPLKIKGKVVKRRAHHKKGEGAPSVFISEKAFSPKFFLLEVHKATEYKELEQGSAKLKQTIAERSETTKEQIKKHFSKFVSAKSTVDSFYSQMKSKNLISREDYGIAPFLRQLGDLEGEANNLYGPVLERRSKAERIRITLSILEQWKFFFNLASSLKEMIRRVISY